MSVLINRTDLSMDQKQAINKNLSIIIEKGTRNKKIFNTIQCWITTPQTVRIPLYYSVEFLNQTNDKLNHFRPEVSFTGDLYSYQKDLTQQGVERLAKYRSFTLIASPGAGKTVMGVWYGCRLGCVTCILIDGTSLMKQWKDTIKNNTNGSCWVVGEGDLPEKTPDFIICMILRVEKIPENIRKDISLLIIDEAHAFCTKIRFERIMLFNPIYLISMTATPNKKDGSFEIIHRFSGDYHVTYSSDKPVKVNYINTPFEYSRVMQMKTVINEHTGAEDTYELDNLDWSIIDEELHFLPERNEILLNLIMKSLHKKILVLSGRKLHVDLLVSTLKHYDVECAKMSGSDKTYSDSNVLIGTVSKIGKGFDEKMFCPDFSGKRIDMVIIFKSYKSLIQLEQNIGRSRADFPEIWHFRDKDSIITSHFRELKKFYLDPTSKIKATVTEAKIIMDDKIKWPYDINGEWILPIDNSNIKIVDTGKEEVITFNNAESSTHVRKSTPKIKLVRHNK